MFTAKSAEVQQCFGEQDESGHNGRNATSPKSSLQPLCKPDLPFLTATLLTKNIGRTNGQITGEKNFSDSKSFQQPPLPMEGRGGGGGGFLHN